MRPIDADALKKLVKEFRDDAPQSSIRRYVCNVILSMLGDENQTPTIEAGPKWISVKDKLPDVGVPVLVAYHNFIDGEVQGDSVAAQLFQPACWYWWEGSIEDCDNEVRVEITHWMPLPEPPKED